LEHGNDARGGDHGDKDGGYDEIMHCESPVWLGLNFGYAGLANDNKAANSRWAKLAVVSASAMGNV